MTTMNTLLLKMFWNLGLFHVLIGDHIKLSHRQCYDSLLLLVLIYIVTHHFTYCYKRYKWQKKMDNIITKSVRIVSQRFDSHYSWIMSTGQHHKTCSRRTTTRSSGRRYHTGKGRIGRRASRSFVPYLMIAATYCRAMPIYSAANNVENLRMHAPNKNDDHGFNIDELWSEIDHAPETEISTEEEALHEELKYAVTVVHHIVNDDALDDEADFLAYSSPRRKFSPEICQMDTDSYPIGIDTYASRCISPHRSDFIKGTMVNLAKEGSVKPFGKGPGLDIKQMGTIKWSFQDDFGITHKFHIKNALYVPDGTMRLLSPQHFAVNASDNQLDFWNKEDFTATQHWNRNVLRWGSDCEFQKTVHNSRRSNVPTFYSSPITTSFQDYSVANAAKYDVDDEFVVYETLSDDPTPKSSAPRIPFMSTCTPSPSQPPTADMQTCVVCDPNEESRSQENLQQFQVPIIPDDSLSVSELEDDNRIISATTRRAEFMRWHYRLGHMSFAKMRRLAKHGYLPRWMAEQRNCKCKICQFGEQHRTPWRTKGEQNSLKTASKPGECVSVDQLESSTAGFYGQLKGILTNKRYKYATVFVDHYSRFTYIHLQETLTSKDTVRAKEMFEAKALEHGVKIEHYHADNGRFSDNAFRQHVHVSGQTITFCGVNAHWQNGIAEKAIRDIKNSARTQLLHAMDRWPGAIAVYLWPYAMRHAVNLRNNSPFRKADTCPLEKFTGSSVQPNLKTFHTFGCPVYVLNNSLQQKKQLSTWLPRSRLGIYLGLSDQHARSVSLVMSLTTGLVSPQFHVDHDDFFESLSSEEKVENNRTWMVLAGFRKGSKTNARKATLAGKNPSIPLLDTAPIPLSPIIDDEITEPPEQHPTFDYQDPDVIHYGRGHRTRRITDKVRESLAQRKDNIVSYKATDEEDADQFNRDYYEQLHQLEYIEQNEMENPVVFKASTNPDIMYYHQAMAAPDKPQFVQAIIDEVNAHIEGNHWEMVPIEQVPKDTIILDSVWAMRRKRDIKTREIYKHKARLNLHGGQQIKGIHYDETYSPVVQWASVRMALILSVIHGWHSRQIDFVLAFPQADIPHDNYMKLPKGIKTVHGDGKTHVLKIKKNLYGGKNAGKVWFDYLKGALKNIGFEQSTADPCVFYRKNVIFMFFVDDGLFFCKDAKAIDQAIADLSNHKKTKKKLTLDDQGDINDYLGINFEKGDDGRIRLTQPQVIDDILNELGIDDKWSSKPVPASSTKILHRDINGETTKAPFNYRKVIGKLNFLEKSTRPDIAYAVHQCARFSSDPKKIHYDAVMYLGRYLKGTRSEGIIINPRLTNSFEVWADADWSGNWIKETAEYDPSTAKSRTGYTILLSGCPIVWASKLQTQIALSSCEAEYICLSQALRETIPLMRMIQELKDREFLDEYMTPSVHCKAFEDNSGCVELAKVHKMRPRTKHINITYHHFREAVREGKITIHQVKTEDQIADIFTKPLQQNLLVKFRKLIMGW